MTYSIAANFYTIKHYKVIEIRLSFSILDFFKMLGNVLKITILLIAWTSHYSAQFDLKNYPNIPGYYGEDLSEELVKSKLKDSELYDRYRIRRHFMPQRFGKRYTSKYSINI